MIVKKSIDVYEPLINAKIDFIRNEFFSPRIEKVQIIHISLKKPFVWSQHD
jgi:hypothetical protein